MLVCDVCDKGFHTYCLRPPVSCIPKNGFKCERCRICSDCGAGRSTTLNGLEVSVAFNSQLVRFFIQLKIIIFLLTTVTIF